MFNILRDVGENNTRIFKDHENVKFVIKKSTRLKPG